MKWVKIGQIPKFISISEQKIRQLCKDHILKENVHYTKNSHIGHTLYNLEKLEKWLLEDTDSVSQKKVKEKMKGW